MKKKIFFILVAIIEIIAFIAVMTSAKDIVQETVKSADEMYTMFPEDVRDEMLNSFEKNGPKIIVVFSAIGIILNIITLYIAVNNGILRNKGRLIVFSIIIILLGTVSINQLLSIISILVLLCLKREKPEDFPVKKDIPKLEIEKSTKKEIIIGAVLALIYFSQFLWKDYIPESKEIRIIITVIFYLTVFVLSIAYWNKRLLKNFKTFGKNFSTYIKFIFPRLLGMYGIYFIVAIFSAVVTGEVSSVNQENLESMKSYIVVPLAIFWAPIVEETIFRGLLRPIIKNKYLYIIISSLCFGLIHTAGLEASILNTVVKALPYATMGFFLSYLYEKSDNISTSMFGHSIINVIGSIMTLI